MSSRGSIRRLGLFHVQTSNHAVVVLGVRDRVFPDVCRTVFSLVGSSNAYLKYVRCGRLYITQDSAVFNSLDFLDVADE
jgi:hypothetical protein